MTSPARTLAVMAMACAHVPPLIFGALTPGYRATSQYISELGAVGAPYAAVVNLGTFLPAGVLLVAACAALRSRLPRGGATTLGLTLTALIGVSWIVAAFAPCDAGCPAEGSTRQALHNLAGVIGYVGGGIGFFVIAVTLAKSGARPVRVGFTALCGVLLVGGLLAMASPELAAVRGALQRVMELTASAWILMTAWHAPSWRHG